MIVKNKNIFIQLLIQKFLTDLCNIITDEKANAKLLNLAQKKDKDLYIYYSYIKALLKRIYR